MNAAGLSSSILRQLLWIFVWFLFQFLVDSSSTTSVVRRKSRQNDQFSNDVTDSYNRKWLSQVIERRLDNRNLKQRVDMDWRQSETKKKTPHRVVNLFTFNQGTPKRYSGIFNHQPYVIYNTFKMRTRRNRKRLHTKKTVAVHSAEDYAFLDIAESEEPLYSYAVKPSLKEKKGPIWHIAVVSGALLVLIVVCLCVHAPCGCLWRRTHRHGKHEVVCPIAGSNREMCGKCFLQRNASHVTINMDKCDARYHPSSSQGNTSPWQRKTAADFRYKPLKNRHKRDSQHSLYDPEWTSVGAFLNKNRSLNSYHSGYGSLKESESKFVTRYCRRSRDSINSSEEVVECALKLRPRRRQVIELQEFPLGYSKSFLNINLESNSEVLFDPYRDQLQRKTNGLKFDRLAFSDSDLRKLSCTDKLENYDGKSHLFTEAKPRKSSLKIATGRRHANEKVVHFFPSTFEYNAQFVQLPSKAKMEENIGEFERRFNLSRGESVFCNFNSRDEQTIVSEQTKGVVFCQEERRHSKEHAIDEDLTSPTIDNIPGQQNFLKSRDYGGCYVNYGCESSTVQLTSSKEEGLGMNPGSTQPFYGNMNSDWEIQNTDKESSFEPLAGLLSPIRRTNNHNKGATHHKNKEVTWDKAYDHKEPFSERSTAASTSVLWGDVMSRKTELDKNICSVSVMPYYEQIQHFPEKEEKTDN